MERRPDRAPPPGAAAPPPSDPKSAQYKSGFGFIVTSSGLSAIAPPWTTMTAYDLNEGTIKWQTPLGEVPELAAKGVKTSGSHMPKVGPVDHRGRPDLRRHARPRHPCARRRYRQGTVERDRRCRNRRHAGGLSSRRSPVRRVLRCRAGDDAHPFVAGTSRLGRADSGSVRGAGAARELDAIGAPGFRRERRRRKQWSDAC